MELTTRGRYAVMAMADLARHESKAAQPLSQIAERQRLPLSYLEQLFVLLRRAGLVESARGRAGGYRLGRSAGSISVADVMRAVEEDTQFTRCHEQEHGCSAGERCITHDLWRGLSDTTSRYLAAISLADVVAARGQDQEPSRTYLDCNATAPLLPVARAAMIEALDATGNPSSVHVEGRAARHIVEAARESVALLVNAKPSEVVFTSGATEANAWALSQPCETIFASGIEHDSVLGPARAGHAHFIEVPAGADGIVSIEEIAAHVLRDEKLGRALVALQWANNETGVVQPVADMAAFAHEHGLMLHVDAVQAAGRIAIDFSAAPIRTLSLSSHKMGGPKGVGALVVRDRIDLVPLIRGGGQERRRRAGTENVAGIAGFGAAALAAREQLARIGDIARLRDKLEAEVRAMTPEAVIIGQDGPRLANTSAIALPGRLAETMVIRLDLAGIAVSAGSACSSGKVGASHVLEAMGLPAEISRSAIRVSLGAQTREQDIAAFLAAWKAIASQPALAA